MTIDLILDALRHCNNCEDFNEYCQKCPYRDDEIVGGAWENDDTNCCKELKKDAVIALTDYAEILENKGGRE